MDSLLAPFPLLRAGGFFLVSAGLFFGVSRLDTKREAHWTVVAFGAGALAATFALALKPSLGQPNLLHWTALGAGILFEIAGIAFARRRFAADARRADLAILIVGLHFLPMVPAIGPLIGIVGLLCVANAAWAWPRSHISLRRIGLVDAGLKIGFGLAMALAHPIALSSSWS
ncbi:DUF6609 family protein [Thermaurantiacus sp.]